MLEEVKSLAKRAGRAILEVYGREDQGVAEKEDKSPVTEADRKADEIIIEGLRTLTPELPVLTEESAKEPYSKRSQRGRFWLVDPLDGTREFLKKTGQFTVNIALVENGEPIMGVVWAPAVEFLYWAEKGRGAYQSLEGTEREIKTRTARLDQLGIVASKDHAGPQIQALTVKYPGCELKSMGSSLKLCLVASGEADLYLRDGPTMEWDTAAAQAIVNEAGGVVQRWDGNKGVENLVYNKQELRNPQFLVKGDPSFEISL